jgi:hypothetical protein
MMIVHNMIFLLLNDPFFWKATGSIDRVAVYLAVQQDKKSNLGDGIARTPRLKTT